MRQEVVFSFSLDHKQRNPHLNFFELWILVSLEKLTYLPNALVNNKTLSVLIFSNDGTTNIGIANIGLINLGIANIGLANIDITIANIGIANIGLANLSITNIRITNICITNIT